MPSMQKNNLTYSEHFCAVRIIIKYITWITPTRLKQKPLSSTNHVQIYFKYSQHKRHLYINQFIAARHCHFLNKEHSLEYLRYVI